MASKFTDPSATFELPVRPTRKDLAVGERHSTDSCPLATQFKRDIARRFRRWDDIKIEVGSAFVTVKAHVAGEKIVFRTKLGLAAREFIADFDEEKPVTPGDYGSVQFEMDVSEG